MNSTCTGCGRTFNGERGLRAHQSRRFVTMACKPLAKPGAYLEMMARQQVEARNV